MSGRIARKAFLVVGAVTLGVAMFAQSPGDLLNTGVETDRAVGQENTADSDAFGSFPAMPAANSLTRTRQMLEPATIPSRGGSNESLEMTRPANERPNDSRKLKAEPPSEFQKFVKTSAGMELPIFGASLFEQVPSTFAPVDRIPVAPDYTVGPGDELDLRVWGQINSSQRLVVDRTGDVFLPQVGRIRLAGLRFVDVEPTIKTNIGRVFRNFDMSVNMGQLRSIQVFVMGRARRPGTYTVSALSTLVNALFVSGGPSSQGSMRNIQLKRSGQVVTRFDFYDLLLRGDKTKDLALQPGDVIYIPPVGPQVAVGGSVESPAVYEIAPNTSLGEVLSFAGGLSPVAAGQHAVLERVDQRATLGAENLELNADGLETALQDGDIVKLLQVVPKFNKTVALKGNVADPVRLPWHEGMKVSDVIPDKQALLTRNFWEEHNTLTSGSSEHKDESRDGASDRSLAASTTGRVTTVKREFTSKNDLQPPAPDINWNYAAIERLDAGNLTTHLIAFNLGKAVLDRDPASDLSLQPGDVINVFSKADFVTPLSEQTRYVRLEGEVKMAGVYSVQPGETLRQVLERAGGLTDKAYLFGSAFTRESTRKDQQKRLNDYIDQLERDIEQSAAALPSKSTSPMQEQSARMSLTTEKEALEKLRATPATGRVVLNLQPDANGVSALPDLPLENGDRFVIPSAPATVNVMGTVYNQSTLLYKENSSIREYLDEAGGPTRFADEKHIFVIQADGSVTSRANGGHFLNERIHAGDTVVVPANVLKTSKMRAVLDWSQVVSGLGVGAAAVNVLK
ncbi:MAG: SLBB domain-containing protein [Acidobacteriaceae bacterium]|nr:SLBB domain-containing protein [Acidobacteriaceae bacterium]